MKRSREPDEESISFSVDSDDIDRSTPEARDEPRSKITELDPCEDSSQPTSSMTCLFHSNKLTFPTYEEYESHYNKEHVNRCLECKKNFPSEHFLNLHIEECHDSFVRVKRDQGEHTVSITFAV